MDRLPLEPDRLRAALGERWTVTAVAETASTNADLLAAPGADRSLLLTHRQTAGRGRFDRVWTSPPGAGLTFSMLLRPSAPLRAWGWLPLLTGVALAGAVRAETGVAATVKWPNDLLAADGRKLAGVLVQAAAGAAVIGVGLNVSTSAEELPVPTATSLALAGAGEPDRVRLLAAIASGVDDWVQRLDRAGGDARACGLHAAYQQECSTLGRPVAVLLGGGERIVGIAGGLDSDGALELTTDLGRRSVHAGDVEHLRPA